MSRIVRSVEVRKAILGFALVLLSAVGLRAYEAVRFDDCSAQCGPCYVQAIGCASCEAGGNGSSCYAQGVGCGAIVCDCGGNPDWECAYYEY